MSKTSIVAAIKTELDRAGHGSHAELARRMGVHPPQINDIIRGRGHIKTIQRAVDVLGLSVVAPTKPAIVISSAPTQRQLASGRVRNP